MNDMQISKTIDTVRTIYKELFTIRFVHSGYGLERGSLISDSIKMKPDKSTDDYFKSCDLDYRLSGNSFVCFMRTRRVIPHQREPQVPFIITPEENRLRFLIYSTPDFISKTFVVNTGIKWVYWFSNRINNVEDGAPDDIVFLNQDIETFSLIMDYFEGTIVKNGTDLFAALKSVKTTDNVALTNESYWEPFSVPNEAVNNTDLRRVAEAEPSENCFGVIDIHYTGTIDSYKLFGAGGKLLSPVYTISFKSRG